MFLGFKRGPLFATFVIFFPCQKALEGGVSMGSLKENLQLLPGTPKTTMVFSNAWIDVFRDKQSFSLIIININSIWFIIIQLIANLWNKQMAIRFQVTLPETNNKQASKSPPLKIGLFPSPKKERISSSNHPFSSAMLVSGRVYQGPLLK